MGLLSELSVIGYDIFLQGENIRLQYQKPDTPPETARRLIDELKRCKAEAVNVLKTSNTITPAKIGESAETIWRNPYPQGTPEARQESLRQIMIAIWEATFDRVKIAWPMGFMSTPEVREAEAETLRIQQEVIAGQRKLIDFRKACEKWENACTK
jgi:hypothetical protein